MKNIILASVIISLCGCSIFKPAQPTETQRIERVAAIAELAAYTGTALRLVDHPEDRPKFLAASDALAAATTTDPAALQRVLATLPVKELRGEKGAVIVGAAVLLYETELKRLTSIDQSSFVGAVSKSVRSGIARALVDIPAK